jgi:hypothetical protein
MMSRKSSLDEVQAFDIVRLIMEHLPVGVAVVDRDMRYLDCRQPVVERPQPCLRRRHWPIARRDFPGNRLGNR